VSLFEPVIRALNDSGTRYAVAGGLATVLHGYPRMTADIDVLVDLSPQPAGAVIAALTRVGFSPRLPVPAAAFADPAIRQRWIDEKGMRVFSLWDARNPMIEVDLFTEHPINFNDLMDRSVLVDALGTRVRVVSIEDLIALKRLAARPQDDEDIRALETILRARESKLR